MPVASQDPLYAAAYAELHRLARRERRRVGAPATINTTALVHEAWFKLGRSEAGAQVEHSDFLAIAAHAMRQVLVDHARRVNAKKRRHVAVTLGEAEHEPPASIALLDLDAALNALEAIDERLARIVELHVFCGLEFAEIAESEGISERGVFRLWRTARVFLMDALAA